MTAGPTDYHVKALDPYARRRLRVLAITNGVTVGEMVARLIDEHDQCDAHPKIGAKDERRRDP